jgi:hypothetical protein
LRNLKKIKILKKLKKLNEIWSYKKMIFKCFSLFKRYKSWLFHVYTKNMVFLNHLDWELLSLPLWFFIEFEMTLEIDCEFWFSLYLKSFANCYYKNSLNWKLMSKKSFRLSEILFLNPEVRFVFRMSSCSYFSKSKVILDLSFPCFSSISIRTAFFIYF